MSRSFKRTPISGWASCHSMRWFRTTENQRFRHSVKQKLHVGMYDSLPHHKEYQNEWDSPRDGKMYFGDINHIKYRCTFCITPHYWVGFKHNHCHCEEFKQHYKELMRK